MQNTDANQLVSRRKVLLTALFAGFWGAHKFMLGARREGYLYLALSWTMISAFATILDIAHLSFAPHTDGQFKIRQAAQANFIEPATKIRLFCGLLIVLVWIVIGLKFY